MIHTHLSAYSMWQIVNPPHTLKNPRVVTRSAEGDQSEQQGSCLLDEITTLTSKVGDTASQSIVPHSTAHVAPPLALNIMLTRSR